MISCLWYLRHVQPDGLPLNKMDDDDEQSAWETCWKININFYEPSKVDQRCIICSSTADSSQGSARSQFWAKATRCSGGHNQILREIDGTATNSTSNLSSCVSLRCDLDYVLNVVKGEHTCRRPGCQRRVLVRESVVEAVMKNDKKTLEYVRDLYRVS